MFKTEKFSTAITRCTEKVSFNLVERIEKHTQHREKAGIPLAGGGSSDLDAVKTHNELRSYYMSK